MKAFHLVAQHLRDRGWRVAWGRDYRMPYLTYQNTHMAKRRKLTVSRRRGHSKSIVVDQNVIVMPTKVGADCGEWSLCDPDGLAALERRLAICVRHARCTECERYSILLEKAKEKK